MVWFLTFSLVAAVTPSSACVFPGCLSASDARLVLDRPTVSDAQMDHHMLRMRDDAKIIRSIVKRVFVNVMNMFGSQKFSSDLLFHHNPMFVLPSPRCSNLDDSVNKLVANAMKSSRSHWERSRVIKPRFRTRALFEFVPVRTSGWSSSAVPVEPSTGIGFGPRYPTSAIAKMWSS